MVGYGGPGDPANQRDNSINYAPIELSNPLFELLGGGPAKGAKYLSKMLSRNGTSLVEVKKIGGFWKYTTKTMARNGNGSYTLTSKYLNAQGNTVKWFHDTYTKTGTVIHRGFTEGSTKVHLWWNGVKQYGDDFFEIFK